jgi:hypothetical protein
MRHPEITAIVGSTRSLQRLENGEATGLTFPIIGSLCDLYEVPPEEKFELQRLWRLGPATTWTQPRGRSVFGYDAYRELELHAKTVYQYEVTFVPGPLQTERYMRTLFSRNPNFSEEDIERHVARRQRAQAGFWQKKGGRTFHFLMSEAALRSGCDTQQIERLVEADSLDYASVKYYPFAGGPPSLMTLPFILLEFPDGDDPEVVYVEAQNAHIYFEEVESVRDYRAGLDVSAYQARSIKEFNL